jgi:hypothetical protein
MFARTMIGVLLGAAMAIPAQAQSVDGTYKGTRTITRAVGSVHCPPPGFTRVDPIEFQVSGTGVTVHYLKSGYTASGTVTAAGSFTIYRPLPAVGPDVRGTWTGQIRARQIRGRIVAKGSSGECRATFRARRRTPQKSFPRL